MNTDAENFKNTFLPMGRQMFAEAIRILGNAADAEDAVQDVYTKLWERRNDLENVKNRHAYVLMMVRNRCLTIAGSIHRQSAELNEADTDGAVSHSDELEARDRISKVMRIIETLPSNQRLVITMHDIEGRTKEEIEHATELSADNVRQLLSRARRFIRDCFAQE